MNTHWNRMDYMVQSLPHWWKRTSLSKGPKSAIVHSFYRISIRLLSRVWCLVCQTLTDETFPGADSRLHEVTAKLLKKHEATLGFIFRWPTVFPLFELYWVLSASLVWGSESISQLNIYLSLWIPHVISNLRVWPHTVCFEKLWPLDK